MFESLPAWVGEVAPVPIIVTVVWTFYWLVSSGRLTPKATTDMIIAQYDKASLAKDQTIASQEKQIESLLIVGETLQHALKSLQEAGTEKQTGSPHG